MGGSTVILLLGLLFIAVVAYGAIFWMACRVSAMADKALEEMQKDKSVER